jgi:hypothetical protein
LYFCIKFCSSSFELFARSDTCHVISHPIKTKKDRNKRIDNKILTALLMPLLIIHLLKGNKSIDSNDANKRGTKKGFAYTKPAKNKYKNSRT